MAGKPLMGTRRWLIALSIVAIALATTGGAIAGHLSEVRSYTGCLTPGGTLTDVREGSSPAKPCSRGAVEAHFSGGDITAITAGTGLTGGGNNGEVELALDPAYALRQDCGDGQVVKWSNSSDSWLCANDNDTTYSAGTGLDLTGAEFSLNSNYRLPDAGNGDSIIFNIPGGWTTDRFAKAGETCPTGQFVRATTNNGFLTCAAPPDGSSFSGLEHASASQVTSQGIPDDGTDHHVLTIGPLAGTYLVIAKGTIQSGRNVDDFTSAGCQLHVNGLVVDSLELGPITLNQVTELPFTFTAIASAGTGISLTCFATPGADGLALGDAKLVAIKID